jgi:MFS family permease
MQTEIQPHSTATTAMAVLRGFPRPVWFLFLGTFINRFGTFVIPFLTLHVTRKGYSAEAAGLTLAALGVGHLLAGLLGGQLADSIGRRPTIALSMAGGAITMLLLTQAGSLGAIALLVFVNGLAGELYRPASSALLADLVSEENRVTAFAGYRFSINAGWALGPAVAGLLAAKSYNWLFVIDAATSAVYGLIALVFLPAEVRRFSARGRSLVGGALSDLWEACRAALANALFRRMMLSSFAIGVIYVQLPSTLSLEMRRAGHSEVLYGLVLALNGALVVLFEIPISLRTQRASPRRVISLGYLLIGLGAGLFGLSNTASGYVAGMAIITMGEIISMPVAMALVTRIAPEQLRGRYLGLYTLTWSAALMVGPPISMALFERNAAAFWLGCGAVGCAAAVVMARARLR